MKGMLLAAGLGTRLRPLTETTPKAMLSMDGHPLIAYGLGLLQRAGIRDIVINLHYLGDPIRKYCKDGSQWGLHIQYSEEPEILGSGGGLKKAAALMGNDTFVAINADTLMDIDIRAVIAAHAPMHAGLMTVIPIAPEDPYGRVAVNTKNQITGFGTGSHTFAGVQIVTPKLITQLPEGESSVIADGYAPLIAAGAVIDAYEHRGYWNDIGTVERYEKTRSAILNGTLTLQPVHPL
jgi:NDP-sugar pyrophosphorylase family protein